MTTTKELLVIEFRYSIDEDHRTKKVTVGIYDSLQEAIQEGNRVIDNTLSKVFEIRKEDYFGKPLLGGYPKRLVTNVCYKDGIKFFFSITPLIYADIDTTIDDIMMRKNNT